MAATGCGNIARADSAPCEAKETRRNRLFIRRALTMAAMVPTTDQHARAHKI